MHHPNLYHLSEEPGIKVFEPRAMKPGDEPLLWAIDEAHLPNYLLPRDCPRVTFFASQDTTDDDRERFFLGSNVDRVIAIETAWLNRVRNTTLYRYTFDPDGFELQDAIAGYYVSRVAKNPLEETAIPDLLSAITERNVELRVLPNLWELRDRVVASTLGYSIIRMRNAKPMNGS